MAENGVFRSAFRGFNKQDVLNYIDNVSVSATQAIQEANDRSAAAQERAAALEAENRQLQSQVQAAADVTKADLQALQEQNEKLTALAQAYKRELVQLRSQLAATELRVADSAVLEERVDLLEKQNEKYARVVGDVGRVVMQARVVSASYFDNAHKSSIECLERLQSFLDEMKEQAAQAVKVADTHHDASGDTIDTLLEQLQNAGFAEEE